MEGGQARQTRVYFILDQLQDMAKALPAKYQQRMTMELLSGLANNLLNDTIFQIVKGLKEMQDVTEKNLYQNRLKLIEKQRMERHKIRSSHLKPQQIETDLEKLGVKHKAELKQHDMSIVLHMDQKVSEQQVMMEKAGIPGFYLTNDAYEIRLQMYIFEFIEKLSSLSLPSISSSEDPPDVKPSINQDLPIRIPRNRL